MMLVLRGLAPFWFRRNAGPLHSFTLGLSWVTGVFLLRTLYWGTMRGVVVAIDPALWASWSAFVDGPDWINAGFNTGLIIGSYYILRALHETIPPDERDRWSILSSPFYPGGMCVVRLGRALNLKRKQ